MTPMQYALIAVCLAALAACGPPAPVEIYGQEYGGGAALDNSQYPCNGVVPEMCPY